MKLRPYFEINTPDSKIDRSKCPGEIDYFGAKNALDYLRLPERVNEIAEKVEFIASDLVEIRSTLERLVSIFDKKDFELKIEPLKEGLNER